MTYGSSQARGQIRAASCQPISQPQQCRIQAMSAIYILAHSNIGIPMWFQCEARDQTCIFMDTSHICLCCTTMGPPLSVLFEMFCCIHALYLHVLFFFSFCFFVFFCLSAISWAAPPAYGGSQAMDRIGAVATGLRQSHSNVGSKAHLQPTPQLTATQDP